MKAALPFRAGPVIRRRAVDGGDMERLVTMSWLVLAAVHAAPAAVLFAPGLTDRLYGVASDGTAGLLIVHRGGLFLAVLVAALFAAFNAEARRAATLVAGIGLISFLLVYARAGAPTGPMRTVALVDAIALVPLAFVGYRAWRIVSG